MDLPIPPIHERVRRLRSEQGLSLDMLAERSGVSRAMLSKIERGATSPTIGLLCKIAHALATPLTRLVAEPTAVRCNHLSADEMITIEDANEVRRTSVSGIVPGWEIELVRYEIPAHQGTGEFSCTESERKILYAVQGSIEIHFAQHTEMLHTGESLVVHACECPHEFRNPGAKTAVLMMVKEAGPERTPSV